MKKKRIIISSLAVLLAGACLVSCSPTEDNPNDDIGGETLKYTITFVDEDGTQLKKEELASGATITAPANPTKDGYTFVGWDYNNDGAADTIGTVSESRTYKAIYAPIEVETYTVTFKADGTTVETLTYTEANPTVTAPAVPAKVGYTGAWEAYTLTTGNVEVNAVYTAIEYTVTFKADGEVVGTETYTVEDKEITVPAVPAKVGYAGAWEAYTLATGNIEVNAVYTFNMELDSAILGKYIFTDAEGSRAILEISSTAGISYTVGSERYTEFTMDGNNITIALANEETIVFTFDSETSRYSAGSDVYKKAIPTEWQGVYYSQMYGLLNVKEDGATYSLSSDVYSDPIVTATGLAFENDTFTYTKDGNNVTFNGETQVLKLISPMEKSKGIDTEWYGTWVTSTGDSVTFAERSAVYTRNGVEHSDYFVYEWSSEYNTGIKTIIFDDCYLTIYPGDTYFSTSDGRTMALKFAQDIITDIPAEYAYRTFALEELDSWGDPTTTTISFTDSGVAYKASSGWSMTTYDVYSFNDGVLTVFSDSSYTQINVLATFEFVDGKLVRTLNGGTAEFTEQAIKLSSITGDYQDAEGNIINITSSAITYLGTKYESADITISGYTITFDGHSLDYKGGLYEGETQFAKVKHISIYSTYGIYKAGLKDLTISYSGLVYCGTSYKLNEVKIFANTVSFGDVTLTYTDSAFTLGDETFTKINDLFGTYRCGTDNSKIIILSNETSTLEYNGTVYPMGEVSYSNGVFTFGESLELSYVDGAFVSGEDTYTAVTNIYISSTYGTYRYNNDNKDLIIITRDGITYAGATYEIKDVKIISNDLIIGNLTLTYTDGKITIAEKDYAKVETIALSEAYGTYMSGSDLITISADGISYLGTDYEIKDVVVVGNEILLGENTIKYIDGEILEGEKTYSEVSQFYALYKSEDGTSIRFSADGIVFGEETYTLAQISVAGNAITFADTTVTFADKTATIGEVVYNFFIEVNAEVFGTYEEADYGYSLVISDGSIQLFGTPGDVEFVSYDKETNNIIFIAQSNPWYPADIATFVYNANTKTYSWDEQMLDFVLKDPLKDYYGTYTDEAYTLVINMDGVSMTYGDATVESYEVGENGGIVVTMTNGDVLTLSYTEAGYSFTLADETVVTLPKFVFSIQSAWIGTWNASFITGGTLTITETEIIPSSYVQNYYDFKYEILDENSFSIAIIASYGSEEYTFTYDAETDTFNSFNQWDEPCTATKAE